MSTAHPRIPSPTGIGRIADRRLSGFERWAWTAFGHRFSETDNARLADDLVRAHWRVTPAEFQATRLAVTAIAVVALAAGAALFVELLHGSLGWANVALLGAALVGGGAAAVYSVYSMLPATRAAERGRAIDRSLAPAMNFVAALSCADVPIDLIVRELSAQADSCGEVAAEAAWIVRDSDALGDDILSAIRAAARRSPSVRFQEFLQGAVTTAENGGELRPYFLAQAERFEREGATIAQGQLERLGVVAESYVAVAVAFPLFLLVLLTVFTLIEGTSGRLLLLVWLTALLVIPAAEIGFAAIFQTYVEKS